jgi:hypothetical protein
MQLARAESALGNATAAAEAAGRALAHAASFVKTGEPSYLIGHAKSVLGEVEQARGDEEAARASFQAARQHLEATLGPEHPATRKASLLAGSEGTR